jgi:hypothetical protein
MTSKFNVAFNQPDYLTIIIGTPISRLFLN